MTGWVVKPVEIDDVPAATLTLASQSADDMTLRRVAEELAQRWRNPEVSRAYVVGGRPRVVQVLMDPDRMAGYHVSPLELQRAVQATNVRQTAGDFRTGDRLVAWIPANLSKMHAIARSGCRRIRWAACVSQGCGPGRDGPDETRAMYATDGDQRGFTKHEYFPSTILGELEPTVANSTDDGGTKPAVTIAVAKKKARTPCGSPMPCCDRPKNCNGKSCQVTSK